MMKRLPAVILLCFAAGGHAAAQSWDTSGNGLLNGTFYFRQVAYQLADNAGNLQDAFCAYGTIAFDGNGNYNLSATFVDGAVGSLQPFTLKGTYSIAASGQGFLSNPISDGDSVYGLVSQGIFIGSSTENGNGYNDLFIAAPVSSNQAANSAFQGVYSVAYMNFPSGDPTQAYDASFQLNPNGRNGLGTVNVTGYTGTGGSSPFNVSEPNVTYAFTNGAATLTFPTANNLAIVGKEFLYISPDGNFVFGGSPSGFDIFAGVRITAGATPKFSGLYYQAGLDEDESNIANGFVNPDTYYGSLVALDSGILLGHQRVLAPLGSGSYDYTHDGSFALNSDGTFDDLFGFHHTFGLGGALRVGFGKGPFLGINVALQAPKFSGSGVFLDPTGIGNAGSSALFTSGISAGELITLYGTGLASAPLVDPTFPLTLGGVQVMINNRPAPIYVVQPTLLIVQVPYETVEGVAQIQVVNNGVQSNSVTAFTSQTAPGVLTIPAGGVGSAAAQHLDYSTITSSNPAQIGETIVIYAVGFGAVTPAVGTGKPTPSDHQTNASQQFSVFIDGQEATVGFAGLTPTGIGLYQLNVTVPSGVSSGNVYVDVAGPDSYTTQAQIAVGGGSAALTPRVRRPRLGSGRLQPRTTFPRKRLGPAI